MAYRVDDSKDTHPDELNLFYTPPTECVFDKVQWIEHRPVVQIKEHNPIEFIIPGSGTQYINLKETLLHIKVKVTQVVDDEKAEKEPAGLINLPLHSLWEEVEVNLQQKNISPSSKNYAYKALVETLLSFDRGAKESQLQAAGYYKDTPDAIDGAHPITGGNTGLATRYGLTKNGQTADFIGPLHADVCQQNRLILNGVEIQIKLWPSPSKFCLMSDGDKVEYRIEIVDAVLKVCKVTVAPNVILAHSQLLDSTPAKYPYERTEIKTYVISKGNFSFKAENLFQGAVPTRMVVFFVKTKSYIGSLKQNPFNFVHEKLNSLAVYLNDESVPAKPLKPDFVNKNYADCYYNLFTHLDQAGHDAGNYITRNDFDSGYTLLMFDLQPSLDRGHFPLIKRGALNIEGTFAESLTENITAFVMAKFPAMFTIDNTRNILM